VITQQAEPTILSYAILTMLLAGTALLAFGKKLTRGGDWLCWVALALLAGAAGWDANLFGEMPFTARNWWVGWILPREEVNAITVGVLQDLIGVAMVFSAVLLAAVVLLNARSLAQESRPSRIYSGLLFATTGASLSWISYTPWLSFLGVALTMFGGFISTGSRWDSNPEALMASRLGWERSWGLLLSFAGACIFAVSRGPLVWGSAEAMIAMGNAPGADPDTAIVGALLFVVGILVQFHHFPFFGWLLTDSEHPLPVRTILNQAFPALAAFALLVRAEPFIKALGLLAPLGWYSLASTALLLVSALFSQRWRIGLNAWFGAGLSLSSALLCFAGPAAGMSLLLGVVFGGATMAIVGEGLDRESVDNPSNRSRAGWLRIFAFFGAAAGTGFLGFVSTFGLFQWVARSWEDSLVVAAAVLVLFLFVHQGWRALWAIFRLKPATDVSWSVVLSPFFLLVASFGVWWTGAFSGGALPQGTDSSIPSLFQVVLGDSGSMSEDLFPQASALYWASWIIAALSAYWASGRGQDGWKRPAAKVPRFARFVTRGYGLDEVAAKARLGLAWLGMRAQWLVDDGIWNKWVPEAVSVGIRRFAGLLARGDYRMSEGLAFGVRKSVDSTAKLLQMIQTGDVRWYLFFAVAAGFLLMLQFMRT